MKTSFSDLPYSDEKIDFGTDRYVKGLIRFIEKSSAPLTIALQGEWGSGKTSLMTRLKRALCEGPDAKFLGIDVNTWEFSMLSTPEETVLKIILYLVQTLTKENKEANAKALNILRGAGNFLLNVGKELANNRLPGSGIAVDAVASVIARETETHTSLSDLRSTLSQAISDRLASHNNKKDGILIFVDDLDRLNPPVAVEVLELLKNIFTLEHCIFVLAIDYDVVVKGLKPKFGELTEKNAREFRSFFDKIIQVPFSLPVNSYRPMAFVLNSLVEIGYISKFQSDNPIVEGQIEDIVKATVGKNPRSIKRLINTLSLLSCIEQEGDSNVRQSENTIDEKILNLIIVAIQVCYPKIYEMLAAEPDFKHWTPSFAKTLGIQVPDTVNAEADEDTEEWEFILQSACSADSYMARHYHDIRSIFDKMNSILNKWCNGNPDVFSEFLTRAIYKSSSTGITAEIRNDNYDKKDLLRKIHQNVMLRISEKRPEITDGWWKPKNITDKGGIRFRTDREDPTTEFNVIFTPKFNARKGAIAMEIWLDFNVTCPERLRGRKIQDILETEAIGSELSKVDNVLKPLLSDEKWFFHGTKHKGQSGYFKSYVDELLWIHSKGWLDGMISNDPRYWIDLKNVSYFEEKEIIDCIADLLIANYDFRKAMRGWK